MYTESVWIDYTSPIVDSFARCYTDYNISIPGYGLTNPGIRHSTIGGIFYV